MIVFLSITLNKNISNWDPPRKFNPWIRLLSYCLECVGDGNKNQVQLLVNDCITPSPIKLMSKAWELKGCPISWQFFKHRDKRP